MNSINIMPCAHDFFQSDYHTKICYSCGIEISHFGATHHFKNCSYEQRNMPFSVAYSRKRRFLMMLEHLFFATLSHLDNHIVEMMTLEKSQFKNIGEMFKFLKKKKCSDKRYLCMHGFARIFVKQYRAPRQPKNIFDVMRKIGMRFEQIEVVFLRLFPNRPFFNYAWLLNSLLHQFDLVQYCRFVKKLQCRKRKRVYREMLDKINCDSSCTNLLTQDGLLVIHRQLEPR